MSIRNTMCRLSDLTNEQIDNLVDAMPDSNYFDFYGNEPYIGVTVEGTWGTWVGGYNPSIRTYTEMMQLLGKKDMKEFTKSDLKAGMFVKNRNGDYKIVVGEFLSGIYACTMLRNFSESLIAASGKHYDIVSVYKAADPRFLSSYLKGESLAPIWERTEQTEAQKEMEILQEQAKALQEQITKLQGKL